MGSPGQVTGPVYVEIVKIRENLDQSGPVGGQCVLSGSFFTTDKEMRDSLTCPSSPGGERLARTPLE